MSAKTRAANWTPEELDSLIDGYLSRKDIFEGKSSFGSKTEAWNELTDEVNVVSPTRRSVEQVKKQISDTKTKVKKKVEKLRERSDMNESLIHKALIRYEIRLLSAIKPDLVSDDYEEVITPYYDNEDNNQSDSDYVESEKDHKTVAVQKFNSVQTRKRQYSYQSNNSEDIRPQKKSHSEAMLEIEQQKLEIKQKVLALKRIKLKAYFKELKASGVDIALEEEELRIHDKFFKNIQKKDLK